MRLFTVVTCLFVSAISLAAEPLKISMFSGSAEYKSDETLELLKAHLEKTLGAKVSLNKVTNLEDLPGIEQLESCDLVILYTRRLKLPEDQVAKIKKYFDAGKPVVGIRTASHGIQSWLEFDKEVLGGDYKGHTQKDALAQVTIAEKAKDHPVLAGVKNFTTIGKLYKNEKLAADATVLLSATAGEATQPVAWVRQHKGGKVFYTSLGVVEDFKDEAFLRLLTNAAAWTTKK